MNKLTKSQEAMIKKFYLEAIQLCDRIMIATKKWKKEHSISQKK